jgi:hypothetical protein
MARFATLVLVALAALALVQSALAGGGDYSFDGGTPTQQATVTAGLDASRFNWSVVPHVTVHIAPGIPSSSALPGEIWLDADLLDTGTFAWGVIQHEYAHEVDYFLLDDAARAVLAPQLGGTSWWSSRSASVRHDRLRAERFASTLAWSYWTSPANSMKPTGPGDESAAIARAPSAPCSPASCRWPSSPSGTSRAA